MEIERFEMIPEAELLARLKQTRLRGFDRFPIYQDAELELLEAFDPRDLVPAQRYVLESDFRNIESLYHSFEKLGVDIFSLRGGLMFWLKGEQDEPIPLTPPVIEESVEPDGRVVLLINDGMHRVYTAMKLGKPINVILARHVDKRYPYYAYALENGWADVEELKELPDNYLKKTYRDPDNYKALFRDFNERLPGVQKQRKRSNPSNLRA